jgi:thiol-disulfide isomerase/thioredoxin
MAPDFKAITINGDVVKLSDFAGKKIVLIDFWANWCVPCRESFPMLKKIKEKAGNGNLVLIAVAVETNDKEWRKAIQKDATSDWVHILSINSAKVRGKYNDDILNKYESAPIPIQYLINKEGKIIGHWIGKSEENERELLKMIDKLIAQ